MMMRLLRTTLIVVGALAVAGCNTAVVPLADTDLDARGKQFDAPRAGEATVYLYREIDVGLIVNTRLDGADLGPMGTATWFRLDLAAGPHELRCVTGEVVRALRLDLEAGQVRFVKTEATTGWLDIRCEISEVPAKVGRQGVLQGRRALRG